MKAFEEDWIAVGAELYLTKPMDEALAQFLDDNEGTDVFERARLAAQAPKMARVLLALFDRKSAIPTNDGDVETVLRDAGVIE